MKFRNKLLCVCLAAVLAVSCVPGILMTANAAEEGIKYVPLTMGDYWTSSIKTAPEMDNYVFGGWYIKEGNEYTALKEADVTVNAGKSTVTDTYAKFVPAEVLSVKAQLDADTQENGSNRSGKASIRLISGLDSKSYQKVGFRVLLANKVELLDNGQPLETTKVYIGLKKSSADTTSVAPAALFGKQASFFSVWRLDDIAKDNDSKIINVTPYWITMDGTKVDGLAKYVHVEDGYMNYISVPINLKTAKKVAAGTMTLAYPDGLELVDNKVEFNGVFPETEMVYNKVGQNQIKFVGNTKTVDEEVAANGIYANLRFKVGTSGYQGAEKSDFLTFSINDNFFCDWKENEVAIDVWDIKY